MTTYNLSFLNSVLLAATALLWAEQPYLQLSLLVASVACVGFGLYELDRE